MREPLRKFWHFGRNGRGCFSLELAFGFCLALELRLGGMEGEIFTLRLGLIVATLYISLEHGRWAKKLHLPDDQTRNTGFYIVKSDGDGLFGHLEIWQREHEWKRGDWSWSYDFDRIIWGQKHYSKEVLHEEDVLIPMPEKNYPAHVKIEQATWFQPRKFWRRYFRIVRADVEIGDGGIPHPGKGTESYNCDDDALLGLTFPCVTVGQAIGHVQEQAQWYRDNYPL